MSCMPHGSPKRAVSIIECSTSLTCLAYAWPVPACIYIHLYMCAKLCKHEAMPLYACKRIFIHVLKKLNICIYCLYYLHTSTSICCFMLFQIYPLVNCKLDPYASALRDQVLGPFWGTSVSESMVTKGIWKCIEHTIYTLYTVNPQFWCDPQQNSASIITPCMPMPRALLWRAGCVHRILGWLGFHASLSSSKLFKWKNGHEPMVLQWTNQSRISVSFCRFLSVSVSFCQFLSVSVSFGFRGSTTKIGWVPNPGCLHPKCWQPRPSGWPAASWTQRVNDRSGVLGLNCHRWRMCQQTEAGSILISWLVSRTFQNLSD